MTIMRGYFYRPQRSCGKVMFLHVSVILSTGGGRQTPLADRQTPLLAGRHPLADTPPGRHSPGRHSPGRQTHSWHPPGRQTHRWQADAPWADTPGQTPPSRDSHCSGRYASYWNAFLFYRSGTVNSNTVNSKFHLIRSFFEIFARFLSFHVKNARLIRT